MKWHRNTNDGYPRVWAKFHARDLNSDELVEYRVEDLTEDRFPDALDHIFTYFLRDEPLSKGLLDDELSVADSKVLYNSYIDQNLSLVCYKENSSEIIGLNVLGISLATDKHKKHEFTGSKSMRLNALIEFLHKQFNAHGFYNVDRYLSAIGLSVKPEYRGRGIAYHILHSRIPLCKELGIPLTTTIFSGPISQSLAKKVGFELNYEITYDELDELGWPYEHLPGATVKTMSLRVDN